jgi:protein-tyrosine phosphatase
VECIHFSQYIQTGYMYSSEKLADLGSQLQKEQTLRYKQLILAVFYTLLQSYIVSIFIKSSIMALDLFVYGRAVGKPKNYLQASAKRHSTSAAVSDGYAIKPYHTSELASIDSSRSKKKQSENHITASGLGVSVQELDNLSSLVQKEQVNISDVTSSKVSTEQASCVEIRTRSAPVNVTVESSSSVCFATNLEQSSDVCEAAMFQLPGDRRSGAAFLDLNCGDLTKCGNIQEQGSEDAIMPRGLVELLNNSESVLLLDCRTFMAFNVNHVVGALNVGCSDRITKKRLVDGKISVVDVVSGQEAKDKYKKLETDAEIIVYDESTTELCSLPDTHPLRVLTKCLHKCGKKARLLQGGLQAFQQSYSSMCSQPDSVSTVQLLFSPTSPEVNHDIDAAVASEILPYVFIGNQRDASSKEKLMELGITHILNVTSHLPLHFENDGIEYKRLPASDSGSQNLKQYFAEAISFIDDARDKNGKVLVHCQAGVSRSPTIVAAYLMARSHKSLQEAFAFIREQRPIVAPNINFMGQLLEFEQNSVQLSGLCPPSQPAHLLKI